MMFISSGYTYSYVGYVIASKMPRYFPYWVMYVRMFRKLRHT